MASTFEGFQMSPTRYEELLGLAAPLIIKSNQWTEQIGLNWKITFDTTISSALHKKWSFPLSTSSVNVTKSAGDCRFGHIYWRNP